MCFNKHKCFGNPRVTRNISSETGVYVGWNIKYFSFYVANVECKHVSSLFNILKCYLSMTLNIFNNVHTTTAKL